MKKSLLFLTFLFATALSFGKVEANLEVHKMILENNQPKMTSARIADPGDVLVYSLKVTNFENAAVTNLNPTLPIPNYTTLDPNLVTPNNFMVSTNNKDYKPYPILDREGKPIPNSEYRSVKWDLNNLNVKESQMFKIGVKVN
ncbi:MAG: hypothetical protein MJH09_09050 [Cetobacterium sp.]|nr:hypothetical protein [Cetobacterium sp.]